MNIEKLQENVRKMAAQNAPMEDINEFIQAAGYTVDEFRLLNRLLKPLPQLAPREKPRVYSPLEKAMYTGRAAAEGITLGLGDVLAGATNVGANLSAKALRSMGIGGEGVAMRDKATGRLIKPQAGESGIKKQSIAELFKEGRRDFVNEQKDFAKEHPILNGFGEAAGGMLPGAMGAAKFAGVKAIKNMNGLKFVPALLKTGAIGAKEGAKFGGIYGFNSGLTANPDKFTPGQAVKGLIAGTFGGALGGAMFSAGMYPFGRAAQFVKKAKAKYQNRSYNALQKKSGDKIHQSIDEKKALLDIADEPIISLAEGVKLKDSTAAQIFKDYGDYRRGDQVLRLSEIIDKHFGSVPTDIRIAKMDMAAKKASDKLYKKAIYGEDGSGVFIDAPWNLDEVDYIQKVYGTTGFKNDVRGKKANHMRVLDYSKQLMDDDISKAIKNEAHNKVANLTNLKQGFLSKIDAQNPIYPQGRRIIERNEHLKNMIKHGEKFNTGTLEGLKERLKYGFDRNDIKKGLAKGKKLSRTEEKYFRYGVRDKLLERFNQFKNDKANLTAKLFDDDTMRRLDLLDIPAYREMFSKIKQERTAMENINRLLGGSQTKERDMSVGQAVLNPKISFFTSLKNRINKYAEPNPGEIARMLTDPGYLAFMRKKAIEGDINAAKSMGKYYFNLMRAIGPLTRENSPDARITSKSWEKIRTSPDYRTYQVIPQTREVYSKGEYHGPIPNNKIRKDNIKQWHWIEDADKNIGLQIGEDEHGRILYNINPKIRAAGNQGTLPGRQPLRITNDPGSIQGSEILSRNSILNKPKKNKPFKIIDILEALNRPYLGSIMVNEIYKNRRYN